jgi:hypothetical protein
VFLVKDVGISIKPGELETVAALRANHFLFGGPVVEIHDTGYDTTVVPREIVCTVPEGHIGQPCLACGFETR